MKPLRRWFPCPPSAWMIRSLLAPEEMIWALDRVPKMSFNGVVSVSCGFKSLPTIGPGPVPDGLQDAQVAGRCPAADFLDRKVARPAGQRYVESGRSDRDIDLAARGRVGFDHLYDVADGLRPLRSMMLVEEPSETAMLPLAIP